MPYVSNMDDAQKNQPGGPITPGGASNTVQLSPNSGIGSVGGGAQTGGSNQAPGGQFASLNQYVNANQGQASGLTNKITGGINDQYNTLNNQNQQVLSGLQGQVDSGYTKQNNDILAQEATNPVSFASNPTNIQSFQGQLNDKYTGPTSAESNTGYQNQVANVQNAISTGKSQVGTEAGRQDLIKQYQAAPGAGVTGLNSAILSQDPNAQKQIENAYNPFSTLVSGLQTGAQGIDTSIGQAQNEAQSASKAANEAIANQTNALNTDVQGQLTNAQNTNSQFTQNYNDLINSLAPGNKLNAQQQQLLGLTPDQYGALQAQTNLAGTSDYMTGRNFGAPSQTAQINNAQFLKQLSAPADVNANQVATPEQFQQLNALLQLNNGQAPANAVLNPAFASEAGTYQAPTFNGAFDYTGALNNATTIEQQERADAQNQANTLTAQADAAHNASKDGFGSFMSSPFGSIAKYIANPLLAVPDEKKLAGKALV